MTAMARFVTTAVAHCLWFTHRIDEPVPADAHSWCEAPSPADHPAPWTCPVCGRVYFADRWHWREQAGHEPQSSTHDDSSIVYHADGTPCGPRGGAIHGPREPGRERELTPICYAHEKPLFDRFAGERERFERRMMRP